MKNNLKEIIIQGISFILFFVILVLTGGNELILTLTIILILLINFKIKYYKGEWTLFLIGLIFGFLIEVGLGFVYRLQLWRDTTFFGVPVWLPIVWGYGFVIIRRIGNLIVNKK